MNVRSIKSTSHLPVNELYGGLIQIVQSNTDSVIEFFFFFSH
jgi:hypothetical protein